MLLLRRQSNQLRSSFDDRTLAWATAAGGASGAQKTKINNLILGLDAMGYWDSLDRFYWLDAENETQALTCIKSLTVATAVASPVFTTNQGYAGDGVGAYIDTNFDTSDGLQHYADSDASYGCYIRTNRTGGERSAVLGSDAYNTLWPMFDDGVCYPYVQSLAIDFPASGVFTDIQGMWSAARSGDTADCYLNGTLIHTEEETTHGTTGGFTWKMLAGYGNSDTFDWFTTDQLAMAYIGGKIDATQAAAINALVAANLTP